MSSSNNTSVLKMIAQMGGEGDERLVLRNLYELSPKEEKEHRHGRKRLMDCLLYGRGR